MEREKKSLKKGNDEEGKRSLEDAEGAKKPGRRGGVKKDTEITQGPEADFSPRDKENAFVLI